MPRPTRPAVVATVPPPWVQALHAGLQALCTPAARMQHRRQARTRAINWGRVERAASDAAYWMARALPALQDDADGQAFRRAIDALNVAAPIAAQKSTGHIHQWIALRVGHRERNPVLDLLVGLKAQFGSAVTYRDLCARTVAVLQSSGFSAVHALAFASARSEPLTRDEEIANLMARVKSAARYRRQQAS